MGSYQQSEGATKGCNIVASALQELRPLQRPLQPGAMPFAMAQWLHALQIAHSSMQDCLLQYLFVVKPLYAAFTSRRTSGH